MRAVGLKVLKNRLSEYIRIVAANEIVLVTDRDRVVAELRPPQSGGTLASDALLAEFLRAQKQQVELATYDSRVAAIARKMLIPLMALGGSR